LLFSNILTLSTISCGIGIFPLSTLPSNLLNFSMAELLKVKPVPTLVTNITGRMKRAHNNSVVFLALFMVHPFLIKNDDNQPPAILPPSAIT